MKYEIRRAKCLLVAAVLSFLLSVQALGRAQENRSSTAPGFESFRIVVDRNIFDPNRRASRPESRSEPKEPAAEPDQIALTGVLIHEGAAVAFFEGTKPEYSVDLKEGGTVAGHRVVEIRTDGLKLSKDGRETALRVGSGMSRQNGGEWGLSSSPSFLNRREPSSGEKPAEAKSSDSSSTDLVERLRKRRTREVGR
jgi:hypothetical protein